MQFADWKAINTQALITGAVSQAGGQITVKFRVYDVFAGVGPFAIAAAARQTSGVNAAMVYGTDGGIEPSGLVVMEDDLNVQPVYRPAPIVRREVLERYPSIVKVLEPVFAKLDLETLQKLNGRVQVGGEAAKSVAVDYLKSEGLIK